ncbi:GNAT family N-acetyltransferase [Lederbergia wuyishanensis]|uniref:Aminoglycoside 6'-N-acetyltransferase n=1 Tax=Lederbergia wuyishanensis TaxID=1347903 RepID=A0ABU0CYT7_9BACI|nr:GNAT family N-acetyltransferase [Lederbergia wuyishanensis]MCJ8005945.1 acetyltransferase [Lederbergia wuyishanensis]MDQ0341310.1 aminoglycoside 6'-N-acetyltransferase [Lederbergia wuyishanensis]
MLFQNDKLVVRTLTLEDHLLLVKWLSDPIVLEYYEGRDNSFSEEMVLKKFYSRNDETNRCILEYEGIPIGYIQYYQLDDEDFKEYGYCETKTIYGMDQFIGESDYWNRGIGKLLVRSMVQFLVEAKQAEKIVMDPQTWNERAIHCYEKCGFKKVKLLPKHELHEGEYRDCWLIEYNPI